MTPDRAQLTWSPHWRLDRDDSQVVLSAGEDRRLQLTDLDPSLEHVLARWADSTGPIDATEVHPRLADRLVEIGALTARPPTNQLDFAGDDVVTGKLAAAMEVETSSGGLTIVVKSASGWPTPPTSAHLACDVSMHHTLVLGPYVVPGLTACTRCLTTRMRRRWPDVGIAPRPAVQRHVHTIAELVAIQVDLIRRGQSPLVNATASWDFETGNSERQTVLKSPGCDLCDSAPHTGKLTLPSMQPGAHLEVTR